MNESQQTPPPVSYDDEIDLRELFRVLWRGKWLISGITSAATVIAVIVALMLPNIYRADALLAPNDQDGSTGLSALASQYGGLASLAGINLGSISTDKTVIGLEILKSRKFISEFIVRHEILVPLLAAKRWDEDSGELVIDQSEYDELSKTWVRKVSPPRKTIPSLQEAYEEFIEIFSVYEDKKTGFVTVSVDFYSPLIAKQWVDWLIDDLNLSIMREDVAEAENAITYLKEQVANTPLAELQSVFFSLIEEQTKIVMLAQVSSEYLLKTLDPAVIPEEKIKPYRALIVSISVIFSGICGVIIQLFRSRKLRSHHNVESPD